MSGTEAAPTGASGATAEAAQAGAPAAASRPAKAGRQRGARNPRGAPRGGYAAKAPKPEAVADEDEGNLCMVCSEPRAWWGVWNSCGHSVCWRCALRIRYHSPDDSKSTICCICQRDSATAGITISTSQDKVPTSEELESYFKDTSGWHVWYETEEMMQEVEYLRGLYCMCWEECGIQTPFKSLKALHNHLWDRHKTALCEVCFEGNTSFPAEQVLYTPAQLRVHESPHQRCHKDPPAFLGHPYCHFCQILLYDNDALYMHMREVHTLCDICEATPGSTKFVFYRDMRQLCYHLKNAHVSCKMCDVNYDEMIRRGRTPHRHPTEWTFATDFELQKHNREEHGAKSEGVDSAMRGMLFSSRGASSSNTAQSSAPGDSVQITFDLGRGKRKVVTLGTALPVARESNTRKHGKPHEGLVAKLTELGAGPAAVSDAKRFVEGGMKAIEFYSVLHSCLSRDGKDIDADTLAAIALCVPDAEKRESLRLAHNMANDRERVSKGETLKNFANAQAVNMQADFPELSSSAAPPAASSSAAPAPAAPAPQPKRGVWGGQKDATQNAAALVRRGSTSAGTVQGGAAKKGVSVASDSDFPTLPGQKPAKVWQAPKVISSHPDPASTPSQPQPSQPSRSPPPAKKPTSDDFPALGSGLAAAHPKMKSPMRPSGVWGN